MRTRSNYEKIRRGLHARALITKRKLRIAWVGPSELWELAGGLYALALGSYLAYHRTLTHFSQFFHALTDVLPDWFWCISMACLGASVLMSMLFQFCKGRVASCTGCAIVFVWIAQLLGDTRDGAWQPFNCRLVALLMFILAVRVTIRQHGGMPRRVLG